MHTWGKLSARFKGTECQQHKILALDGGGIRGILTLEILKQMEQILTKAVGQGAKFRLCHFFDYIGGTRTGAIIAAGSARGMSVDELINFYEKTGPAMFEKQSLLKRWKALYMADPLQELLQQTFEEKTTLKPDDRECLFLAVTRNRTTDSPWAYAPPHVTRRAIAA